MDIYLKFYSCGQEENTLKLISIYSLRILFTKGINILFQKPYTDSWWLKDNQKSQSLRGVLFFYKWSLNHC